jgi:phosphoserine phosphatase RsbU/P
MQVVLADDDAVTRRLVEAQLVARGHEVTAVGDGELAWAAVERVRPTLAVLDWHMPGLDGIEVCRRLRAALALRDTFVLMITGRDTTGDLAEALDAGVDDYVVKPATAEQLSARLLIAERRIALAAARRGAEEELARARWLAGVGETALALQHEINNPLMALLAYAEILSTDPAVPAAVREDTATILAQAGRIAAVVKRLAALRSPERVEYLAGEHMLDLSAGRAEQ